MKMTLNTPARKRPVNLTLNVQLVNEARAVTGNLSGVVESLLADYVARQNKERLAKSKAMETTVAAWNNFNAQRGSIADEYSSL